MKKLFMTLTISSLAAFGLTACSSGEENAEENKQEQTTEKQQEQTSEKSSDKAAAEGPVAIVNGEELSREDFNSQMERMKQQYSQMGMDLEGKEDQLKKSIVDQMIGSELLVQSAKEADIDVTEKEVKTKYQEFVKRFENEEQMKKAFEEQGTSEKEIKKQLKVQLKVDEYIANNTDVKVSDKEMKQKYEQLKKQKEDVQSFEKIKPSLKQSIERQKQQQQVGKLVEDLREKAEVEVKI